MAAIEKLSVDKDGNYNLILNIENFKNKTEERYKSKFSLNQSTEWSIRIYPDGATLKDIGYFSIMFRSHNKLKSTIKASISCSIMGRSGRYKEYSTRSIKHNFKYLEDYGWPRYSLKKDMYTQYRDLTLSFKIKLLFVKFDPDLVPKDPVYSLKPGTRQKLFTDVTVKIQGKEIKAHKLYLAEASEKFLEILSNNPNENVLELKDLEFEIVEKMIEFIYEDQIEGIESSAKVLLIAADKYKMARLRKYCEKSLWHILTGENVIETLRFSIANECDELKTECIEFMARHISEMPQTNWADFIAEFPTLFAELFRQFVILNHKETETQYKSIYVGSYYNSVPEPGDFSRLYMDTETADVTLKIGRKSLLAHKSVLCSRSDVFKAMFEHDTKESRENKIVIMDFQLNTMKKILKYMYYGNIHKLQNYALELLPAADYYNLSGLTGKCEWFLMKNLSSKNLAAVFEVADRHNRPQLKQYALYCFWKDIMKCMQSESWAEQIEKEPDFIDVVFKEMLVKLYPSAPIPKPSDTQNAGPSNVQRANPAQSEDSDDDDEED